MKIILLQKPHQANYLVMKIIFQKLIPWYNIKRQLFEREKNKNQTIENRFHDERV